MFRHSNPVRSLAVLLILVAWPLGAQAVDLNLGPKAWCAESSGTTRPCELGDVLHVPVTNLRDWISAAPEKNKPTDLVLVLNGRVLKGLTARLADSKYQQIDFDLRRLDEDQPGAAENREAWNALLSHSKADQTMEVAVSLTGLPPNFGPSGVRFRLFPAYSPVVAVFLVALLIGFILLAHRSDVLRDLPTPPGQPRRSYSLARCQMAWWFFIVLSSFHYIWMVTGDVNTLMPGDLLLIGISAATGMGALLIDSSKRDQRQSLNTERAALTSRIAELTVSLAAVLPSANADELKVEQLQKQARIAAIDNALSNLPTPAGPSDGLLLDILRDETGISFHRFQMAAWTIVLGFVFVVSVYKTLAMPDFSATLLGLMGISSGTYIGFKIPDPPK